MEGSFYTGATLQVPGGPANKHLELDDVLVRVNRKIIMAPKDRSGRIIRNTHINQSQLSLREQTVDINSSQPSIHVCQQSNNNDEPHLTQLNVGSASQPSPQFYHNDHHN
ncbi:uncharacterized protein [Arachis hypogaea]|uniref:uncharacterized protein isoform X3 n=1 Tax=Arachis hypogaea TaxID=3818 RepID=UPI003B20B753